MSTIKAIFIGLPVYLSVCTYLVAQSLSLPPSGDNQRCSVTQWVGPVSVTIEYSSPDVTAPDGSSRKGKIWGGLVPWGMADNSFGTAEKIPWRGGANENTTITFSHDVRIEGQDLSAGTYGLHFIPQPDEWTVIFSHNATSWGSYFYDAEKDALRVRVQPRKGAYTEWLTYEFTERMPDHTVAVLKWEEMVVPFKIEAPVTKYYLETIRNELHNYQGFDWKNWVQAISFCISNNINLEEALQWSEYAIAAPFVGARNFTTLQAKALVLMKLERLEEADALMDEAMALPDASMQNIHQYGRQLINLGRVEMALEIFKLNSKKFPDDDFTTIVGLARGYEATGQPKKAIRHYRMASENAPAGQRAYYESLARKLEDRE
jgi:hypothetical protein